MPKFECAECGADLRSVIKKKLMDAWYTPHEVSAVCPKCGFKNDFKLEWEMYLKNASYAGAKQA